VIAYTVSILLLFGIAFNSKEQSTSEPDHGRDWPRFDFCAASPCARDGQPPNKPRILASGTALRVEPEYNTDFWATVEHTGVPRFQISTHDPVLQDVYVSGTIHRGGAPWDLHIWAFLVHVLAGAPGGTFVDVGANIGYFTLMAASLGYNVTAFEPMDRNVAKLMASVARNGFEGRVRVVHNAVGQDACGGVRLVYTHRSNQGNGRIVDGESGPVPVVRLDDALDQDVAALKIDVEGRESQVLAGARRLICANRVRYIIMELSVDTATRADCPIYDTLRTMVDIGYVVTDVLKNAPPLELREMARFPPNIVLRLADPSVAPARRLGPGSPCS